MELFVSVCHTDHATLSCPISGACEHRDGTAMHGLHTPFTAVPVKFETAQREIESSADRNATRVTCYIGKRRELAMHLAGQPLELSVSFKLQFGRLQPSLDTEIEQISTKIKQTLLLVLYHRLR